MNKTAKKNQPSSVKQRQLLAIARQQLNMDKDDYKAIMTAHYGVDSSTRLTFGQAEEFIDYFASRGFVIVSKKRRYLKRKNPAKTREYPKVIDMASPAELEKIDALAGLITWRCEDGMTRWMQKFLKIDRVKTGRDAFRAIEGLKKMFENGMVKLHGEDWWLKSFDSLEINAYIAEHMPAKYKDRVSMPF
ncbi:hypothetical protein DO021_21490 [Desulfobacter hydrogenophilus]|uniref:Regulatory protein GemA n=1 Tax=Desulfobacter hydrogenophilus TaxID=2291 RepID=A0A328F990_9BACT|nr:regulatory protein GemA [Desulfobacter hydrogenophilus]NDY74470.1 regulatory protein GemA [Desulfobacter hydrogenophilus]QBH14306.1 regulatory protein GemA [Desulfobacter hydrogenophilus]RAL99971.1 hypothetical protein DO021_21490 [Desulfobacter hydrogenophilus]